MTSIDQVLTAMKARLDASVAPDKALAAVKSVSIGWVEESRGSNALPYICITPVYARAEYVHQPYGMVEAQTIVVTIIAAAASGSNKYTSCYSLLTGVLNCLELNNSGTAIDLHLSDTIRLLQQYSYTITCHGSYVEIAITYEVQTETFQAGHRQ